MDAAEQRRIDAGNDIDLKWLRSFVVVAEEASFTRAATRVHLAQPGVSAQVRRLESELGQQLLDRSGRSVRLTEVGSAVLPFALAALDAVANARLAVDELAGLVRGQVTVGMVNGCALPVLAELLAGFRYGYRPRAARPAAGQPAPRHRRAGGARCRLRRGRVNAADRARGQRPAHGRSAGRPGPRPRRGACFGRERAADPPDR